MKTAIEMAHETLERMNADSHCREPYWSATDDELQAFAELVRADEREACATLCDNLEMHPAQGDCWDIGTLDCAAAIRARSNT